MDTWRRSESESKRPGSPRWFRRREEARSSGRSERSPGCAMRGLVRSGALRGDLELVSCSDRGGFSGFPAQTAAAGTTVAAACRLGGQLGARALELSACARAWLACGAWPPPGQACAAAPHRQAGSCHSAAAKPCSSGQRCWSRSGICGTVGSGGNWVRMAAVEFLT